ncbi:hypothetical protein [Kitasatospora sp. NPDC089509]
MAQPPRGGSTILSQTAAMVAPSIRSRIDGLPEQIRHLAGLHFGW